MGKGEITTTVFRKSNSSILFLKRAFFVATLLGLLCFGWPVSAAQSDKQTLAAIEQKLFFKTYNDEELDQRLRRIEKTVFGGQVEGDFQERLNRVKAAVGPQVNPDGTMSGGSATPSPAPSQAGYPQAPRTVQPAMNEADSAMDRAKIAVMAAREEQISKLLAEGVEMWRHKRGPEAIDRFEQVIRLDPHNAEAHFSMGIVYESTGNLVEADASYKRAQEEQPGNKDYQDAVRAVEKKLTARQPIDDKKAELSKLAEDASAAYKRGEYLSALSLYKELDQKAPNQALVKYNIGTLFLAVHDPVSALDYYKQAYKLNPKEPRYQQAVQQLGANVQKAENEQRQAEAAWVQANPQQGGAPLPKGTKPPKAQKPPQQKNPFVQFPAQQTADQMAALGLIGKSSHGSVVITTVGIGSRAARAGLQTGDMIKAVDGIVVKSPKEMNELLSRKQPGAPVQLTIERGKQMGMISL